METQAPQFLEVGQGRRKIAYRLTEGDPGKAPIFWLPGFLSDMESTKALAVADWARRNGHPMLRFDYSGHGLSGGALLEATIGDWLEEAVALFGLIDAGPRLLIGSSMGGWIALLLARQLAAEGRTDELCGLVLIAPAWDMTEALMWRALPGPAREEIVRAGVTYLPSAFGDDYPVTKRLIEEGRSHLTEGRLFDPGCPVRILQGMRDEDVPWRHAVALLDLLEGGDVELTLVKDAEHRQSRDADLRRLIATVAALSA
jgi:pimeloyl-ACP methyl ester carboxylesterase